MKQHCSTRWATRQRQATRHDGALDRGRTQGAFFGGSEITSGVSSSQPTLPPSDESSRTQRELKAALREGGEGRQLKGSILREFDRESLASDLASLEKQRARHTSNSNTKCEVKATKHCEANAATRSKRRNARAHTHSPHPHVRENKGNKGSTQHDEERRPDRPAGRLPPATEGAQCQACGGIRRYGSAGAGGGRDTPKAGNRLSEEETVAS